MSEAKKDATEHPEKPEKPERQDKPEKQAKPKAEKPAADATDKPAEASAADAAKGEAPKAKADAPKAKADAPKGKGGEKKKGEGKKAEQLKAGQQIKGVPPRLRDRYHQKVTAELRKRFAIANPMMVPRLSKIVVNMGVGKAVENKARIEHALRELGTIVGQRPVITKSRKSIAQFKLRDGQAIGVSVTLRGAHMWEFLDRLISVAIPRIRDFRGLPDKLDGRGNYTMGLSEQSVFPEIHLDKVEFVQGMNITFVTTAQNDEQGRALLAELGMPFLSK